MPTKTKRKSLAHVKKLSTLLAIGLRDLKKQERTKNSVVDMSVWYSKNGQCATCLAGSVMRFSFGCRKKETLYPVINGREFDEHDFSCDTQTYQRLWALNDLRCGDVYAAADRLGVETSLSPFSAPEYDGPNGEWWAAMKQLLADLRRARE